MKEQLVYVNHRTKVKHLQPNCAGTGRAVYAEPIQVEMANYTECRKCYHG